MEDVSWTKFFNLSYWSPEDTVSLALTNSANISLAGSWPIQINGLPPMGDKTHMRRIGFSQRSRPARLQARWTQRISFCSPRHCELSGSWRCMAARKNHHGQGRGTRWFYFWQDLCISLWRIQPIWKRMFATWERRYDFAQRHASAGCWIFILSLCLRESGGEEILL